MKLNLTDRYLEKQGIKNTEIFLIQDIVRVHVKKTLKKSIREILLKMSNGNTTYINALHDAELFINDLLILCNAEVKLSESREPLDYDHPFFYVIFGILFGVVIISSIRVITGLNDDFLRIFYLISIIYIFGVGVFWILKKPFAKRYGHRLLWVDYITGLLIACAGGLIYFLHF